MAANPLVEKAKQGDVNAIASLMNRLLKSQGMLANVEGEGDRLEILIESDLRSMDDEVRIPKRQVLVGMLKKWFITLEVQNISSIKISWQQTGFEEPAWTEEINLGAAADADIPQNGGITEPPQRSKIPPLPVFPPKSMPDSSDRRENKPAASSPDLDEMFGEISSPVPLTNLSSNSENRRSTDDSDFLLLSDIPAIPDSPEISDFQSEKGFSANQLSLQNLLTSQNFLIQLAQYIVVCVIIIVTLRGIHAVFGTSKAPKATSASQALLL